MYPKQPNRPAYRNDQTRNILKVKGEGSVSSAPDQANITVGVITEKTEVSAAQQENAAAISAVTDAITALGVPEESIQTVEYRIDTQYDFVDGQQQFRGYRVTHQLRVTLDDIELTGPVVDDAVAAGANSISSIQFSLADPSAFYNEALTLALQDAGRKAETIGEELGVLVDTPPVSVREISPSTTPVPFQTALYASAEGTPIQPGTLTILAVVETEFTYN
ncbi:SIMPL domain-containing protein [Alteribacter lacisalsi]|uniref:SIMPL domain-containing protein n=1 Tax=Alteribacter lacisalsi TaxID=2045244 RepID=A0A2W0H6P1_9BACI|nr:SIMPL domain-containing protein [Alteribacter lacisalsi]PYZ96787.1 SIMPL domain-containing protein [Alteribacter lacisalsi]